MRSSTRLPFLQLQPEGGTRYGCMGKKLKTEELVVLVQNVPTEEIPASFTLGDRGQSNGEYWQRVGCWVMDLLTKGSRLWCGQLSRWTAATGLSPWASLSSLMRAAGRRSTASVHASTRYGGWSEAGSRRIS